jgi:hypothetical protein
MAVKPADKAFMNGRGTPLGPTSRDVDALNGSS